MFRGWLAILYLLFFVSTEAQENPQYWGIRTHSGVIWAHSADLIPQSKSHPVITQLEWSRISLRESAWEKCNCYSRLGLAFQHIDFNNAQVLGRGYGLVGFTEPFLNYKSKFYVSTRLGLGPVYLDQVYHPKTNPENQFFSAPLSFILLLNLSVNYRIHEHWNLSATAHYNHISNGGVRLPNKGINYPTIGVGVDYIHQPTRLPVRSKNQQFDSEIRFYVGSFFSPRTAESEGNAQGHDGWMIGLQSGGIKYLSPFNAVGLGIELSHDGSLYNKLGDATVTNGPFVVSSMLQHYFTLGQFYFSQQLGIYTYRDFAGSENIFQRYVLTYNSPSGLYLGTSLKAHAHVAEHIDVHIGLWLK